MTKPNFEAMTYKDFVTYLDGLDKKKRQYPLPHTNPEHKKNYKRLLRMENEVVMGYLSTH